MLLAGSANGSDVKPRSTSCYIHIAMSRRPSTAFMPQRRRLLLVVARLVIVFLLISAVALHAAPVLMISIDGLKPEYVTHASEHGLQLPTLQRFLTQGTYADGVVPVLPTVTYPDHTTLITGVWPAEHGIYNNPLFDPDRKLGAAWYWYAESIRVPTLWDAARRAGMGTASLSWPVSVDAASVDTLIPEYWRIFTPEGNDNPQDRYLMAAISRPAGMLAAMEQRLGPYMAGNATTVEGDRTRTRFSLDILEHQKPGFMTIHLSSLDESEHLSGPFSEEAKHTLVAIDEMVGQLMRAALKNDPKTAVVVVSDHGFAAVDHALNLTIPFLEAGLITTTKSASGDVSVTSWKAQPWSASGLAAIMLHDPADNATRSQVETMLQKLAADPANGISKILTADEIRQAGGFPDAAFVVALRPGFTIGGELSGTLVSNTGAKGTHGYLPTFPEMHASFFAMGPGIARGRDLGVIDMRQIAPTVASLLGVNLPTAKQAKLKVEP
jgi:predicted AlkP superfamily pyrophosphatase or phosphodiesterase